MKYKEIEYTDSDIGTLFIECCDEVFKHIHQNKDEFQMKFYKKGDWILLDFVDYSDVFNFNFEINHLIEDTIREVTTNIKRKREKINTEMSIKSVNLKSKIINDSDYFSPIVTSEVEFKYNISYRKFNTSELKEKMTLFVKYLSKSKKKKALKHSLSWKLKASSANAKSFYNMLVEQFKLNFSISSEYFKIYTATNEDIKKILDKNINNDVILSELKSAFEYNSYKANRYRGNLDCDNITIFIDTIEHIDMVEKSKQYKKSLLEKNKKSLEKLL